MTLLVISTLPAFSRIFCAPNTNIFWKRKNSYPHFHDFLRAKFKYFPETEKLIKVVKTWNMTISEALDRPSSFSAMSPKSLTIFLPRQHINKGSEKGTNLEHNDLGSSWSSQFIFRNESKAISSGALQLGHIEILCTTSKDLYKMIMIKMICTTPGPENKPIKHY